MDFFSLRTIKVHGDSDLVQYFEELWHSAWHLLRKSSLYQIGLREWKKMHLNSWWQQSWPKSNQRRRKQLGGVTICPSPFSRIRRNTCSIKLLSNMYYLPLHIFRPSGVSAKIKLDHGTASRDWSGVCRLIKCDAAVVGSERHSADLDASVISVPPAPPPSPFQSSLPHASFEKKFKP